VPQQVCRHGAPRLRLLCVVEPGGGRASTLRRVWVEALGWFGSALLVYSVLQARLLRLRVLGLGASVILAVFNGIIEVWPMVAMNATLAVINLFYIVRLTRHRHDEATYEVLQVGRDDAFFNHVVEVHEGAIRQTFPNFNWSREVPDRLAFLITRGDETVGVIVARDAGNGVAQVEIDYVTPRFRDFTPGEFVYRRSGLFRERGFHRIVTPPGMVEPYYEKLGFSHEGDSYVLDLDPAEGHPPAAPTSS
jgi:hypothetical protein